MSTAHESHGRGNARDQSRAHPTTRTFLVVGLVLALLTAIEFGMVYITGMRALVIAVLAALSIVKLGLVAGYFMHLRFDHKYLALIFAAGALLAVLIVGAQVAVFSQ